MKLIIATTLIASTSAMSAGYLSNLATNPSISGGGLGGYLDHMVSAPVAPTAGAGMGSYLDNMAVSGAAPATAGAGLTTHIDSLSPAGAAPVPVAAVAPVAAAPVAFAPVAAAPVAVAAPVAAAAPSAAGVDSGLVGSSAGYLGHLASDHSIHGAGLTTHVDTLATNGAPTGSGAAFTGYLGALPPNAAAISGPGIGSFTDILLSNTSISAVGAPVAAGIAAAAPAAAATGDFLQNVYNQLMALSPADVASAGGTITQTGNGIAFAAASGSASMSFVKN